MLSIGKLLISGFVTILIGVILLNPIADDVEKVKTVSFTTSNESITLTAVTSAIINETISMSDAPPNKTGSLTYQYLTELTSLINETNDGVLGECNVTLADGTLECNETSAELYANYTYNAKLSGLVSDDEPYSLTACRNSTATTITINTECNLTISNRSVILNFYNFSDSAAYLDYERESDEYVRSAAARSILDQTRLFFAITVMLIGAGMVVLALKKAELI